MTDPASLEILMMIGVLLCLLPLIYWRTQRDARLEDRRWDQLAAEGFEDSDDWGPKEPSDRAGYSTRQTREGLTFEVEGFRCQVRETLYEQLGPKDRRGRPQVEQLTLAHLRIQRQRAPAWAQAAWRFDPGHSPARQEMARAHLAHASLHLDDQIELPLKWPLTTDDTATTADRCVQGVAALCLAEDHLLPWLAAAEDDQGRPRPGPRRERLTLSLLTWFEDSPQAAQLAQNAHHARNDALRTRARIFTGPNEDRWRLSQDRTLPLALRTHALRRALQEALREAKFQEIQAQLIGFIDPPLYDVWVQELSQDADPERVPSLETLFQKLFNHPRLALPLAESLAGLGAPPWASLYALTSPSEPLRARSAQALIATHSAPTLATLALQRLSDILENGRPLPSGLLAEQSLTILFQLAAEHGDHTAYAPLKAQLEALRALNFLERETLGLTGDLGALFLEAEVALQRVRDRAPEALAGGLSVTAGDAHGGALSVSEQAGQLSEAEPDAQGPHNA